MTDIAELGLAIRSDGIVVAKDRLRDLKDESGSAEKAIAKLTNTAAKLVAAFAGWQIAGAVIGKFVSSTIEAEQAQAKLNAVLKATGGAAGLSASQLTDLATSLQKVTTYGDEAILGAETLLLTFRNIGGDIIPRATEAVLDLASTLGGDLNGAAIQLGKALNDPIAGVSALGRAGVTFSASQKEMIKNLVEGGEGAKAQALILKELENQLGGTARAARGTLGGALSALEEAFGDLFESTGPEADKLRRAVEQLIDKISEPQFLSAVQNFGAALLGALSDALPILIEIIKRATEFFQGLSATDNPLARLSDKQLQNSLTNSERILRENYGTPMPDTVAAYAAEQAEVTRRRRMASMDPSGDGAAFGDLSSFRTPKATSGGDFGPTAEQIAAAEKAAKAYDKLALSAQSRIDQLDVEAAGLSMSNAAALSLANTQDLLSDAMKAGLEITPDLMQQILGWSDSLTQAQLHLEALQETLANRSPWEVMADEIGRLKDLGLDFNDFAESAGKAVETMVSGYASAAKGVLGQAQDLSDALFDIDRQRIENSGLTGDKLAAALDAQARKQFEVNKQISIANAIVAGGEAVVKSYNWGTTLGGPLGGALAAGLAAAATAAQIAAIAGTSYQSKTAATAAGGGGSATPAVAAPAASTEPQRIMNFTFTGTGDISRDQMRQFIDAYNEFSGDGLKATASGL